MTNYTDIWIFAEVDGDKIADVSMELISRGRELADIRKQKCAAILLGHKVDHFARHCIAQGADIVYLADDPRLAQFTTQAYARVICDAAKEQHPEVVLFGATTTGRDLAPRVSCRLMAGCTADCTELKIGTYTDPKEKKEIPNLLMQIRPAFGGNIRATIVNPYNKPQMATVRPGVMKRRPLDDTRKGQVVKLNVHIDPLELLTEVLHREKAEKKVDLTASNIIVAGGAGLGGPEGFKLMKKLADTIGGVVGASRAAVDAGWIDHDYQVGQTGTTVRPKLYIACGISGAIQHRAGMEESSKIVAVNKDANAPIFKIAHYGIVGDLYHVIPLMIDAYKQKV